MELTPRALLPRGCARVALALAAAGLAAGACSTPPASRTVASLPGHGSGNGNGNQTSGTLTVAQSDQDMVDFARCLRSHGVDEPDPFHRPGHSGLSVEIPPATSATNAALSVCNHFLAPIDQEKQAGARRELAAWLPALTRYAQCMRAHDISMLDPDAQGDLNLGNVPGISSDFGRYSPQFRAADQACRHDLPSAIHDDGTGP
jgi:hypothetical protein